MRNLIDTTKKITNKERKFGSALIYVPVVVQQHGVKEPALFTIAEINAAIARGYANPEDAPDTSPWWKKLFG